MVFLVGLCAMLNSFMKQNDVFGSALLKGGKKNVIPPETSPRALNYFNIYLHPPYLDAELGNFFFPFSPLFFKQQYHISATALLQLWREDRAEPKSCKAPQEPEFKTLCCLMCLKCLCAFAAAVSAPGLIYTNGISSTDVWQALNIPAKCCSPSGQLGSAPNIKCQPKS